MIKMSSILFALTITLTGCIAKQGEQPEEFTEAEDHMELTLNNGLKWKANSETTIGIRNMITITSDFTGSDTASYHYLGTVLNDEYNQIFEKCTMMGDAHKQLHAYLLPLNHHIQSLKTCNDSCNVIIAEIKPYLNSYAEYFE